MYIYSTISLTLIKKHFRLWTLKQLKQLKLLQKKYIYIYIYVYVYVLCIYILSNDIILNRTLFISFFFGGSGVVSFNPLFPFLLSWVFVFISNTVLSLMPQSFIMRLNSNIFS